jgi:hypothetical protein
LIFPLELIEKSGNFGEMINEEKPGENSRDSVPLICLILLASLLADRMGGWGQEGKTF